MARFGLWAGDDYYPCMALGDYVGEFESEEAAEAKGKETVSRDAAWPCDWYVVVNIESMTEVVRGRK